MIRRRWPRCLHGPRATPYFVQQWAYQSWNLSPSSPITRAVVEAATPLAIAELDRSFFRVRFDRLTPGERKVLRAMAGLGPGPRYRTGDIALALGIKVTSMAPVRAKLIGEGMIFSPAFGDLAFTVPMFDGFMRRAMPAA